MVCLNVYRQLASRRQKAPFPTGTLLRNVLAPSRRHVFHNGALILKPGLPARELHLIRRGLAKVSIYSDEGQEKILCFIQPGDFIGRVLNTCPAPMDTAVTAMSPTVITRSWSAATVGDLIQQHPSLAAFTIEALSQRLYSLTAQVGQLAFNSSHRRVINSLARLTSLFGQPDHGSLVIPIILTQNDLAKLAAVSRVTVSKTIGTLRQAGILSKQQGYFYIHKPERLYEMADNA